MPEGPSIVILREQLLPYKGRIIRTVKGNAKIEKELLVNKVQTGIYQIADGTLVLKNEININSISYATKTFYFNDISFDDAIDLTI